MSQELVPISAAREEFNLRYGAELHTPTSLLTVGQRERINRFYNIQLCLGTHGRAKQRGEDNNPAFAPTQSEYSEAASVVEKMEPGDTLFIEGYGFAHHTWADGQRLGEAETTQRRQKLEQCRKDYSISAWRYAQELAALKGIPVIYADQDAFDNIALSSAGILIDTSRKSKTDSAVFARVNERRERSACYIVKDWALDHLPPVGTPAPEGRKPKLVLLFGKGHKQGLRTVFENLGLRFSVIDMQSSTVEARVLEQYAITILPELVASATRSISAELGRVGTRGGVRGGIASRQQSPMARDAARSLGQKSPRSRALRFSGRFTR